MIGLLDLAAGAGGRAGHSVDVFLMGLAGPLGARRAPEEPSARRSGP